MLRMLRLWSHKVCPYLIWLIWLISPIFIFVYPKNIYHLRFAWIEFSSTLCIHSIHVLYSMQYNHAISPENKTKTIKSSSRFIHVLRTFSILKWKTFFRGCYRLAVAKLLGACRDMCTCSSGGDSLRESVSQITSWIITGIMNLHDPRLLEVC